MKVSEASASEDNPESWDTERLCRVLEARNFTENVIQAFERNKIDGKDLRHLNPSQLMNMKLSLRESLHVQAFQKSLQLNDIEIDVLFKIFNDPIHGNIELHPACIAIIDTPQYQRLRHLKQLELVYFVYPGASHNRFEHSLGVSHLAGQLVRNLRDNQKNLGITEVDALCVEIAGLCHDLGHGPFSHLFESSVMAQIAPEKKWKHEEASVDMLDHLIKVNKLMEEGSVLRRYGLTWNDITFIKEMIAGPLDKNKDKTIVSNKRNGIDVDKWDYLARDCHQLGIRNNFDHTRYIRFARVCEVEGEMQICMKDEELVNLYNMFSTRYTLHKVAYQHQVHGALEVMMSQILIKAHKHIFFPGKEKRLLTMSECVTDMEAYTHLTDNVAFKILETDTDDKDLQEAKETFRRILRRDLYECVYQTNPLAPEELKGISAAYIKEAILEKSNGAVSMDDFFVQIVHFDYGLKDKNPVERVNVYSKSDPNKATNRTKDEVTKILAPITYKEILVRIYSCNRKSCNNARYKEWIEECILQKQKNQSSSVSDDVIHKEEQCQKCGIPEDWRSLGAGELLEKLRKHDLSLDVLNLFSEHELSGEDMQLMNIDNFMVAGFSFSCCIELQEILTKHGLMESESLGHAKIFYDPIHGSSHHPPAVVEIINTPQFQRLRDIKQHGMVYYVYPGAANNRFEHSLGVSYLAGQFARVLQRNNKELNITEQDILCVQIAGLCNDLGLGPFSTLFDEQVVPAIKGEKSRQYRSPVLARKLLNHLIKENDLMAKDGKLRKCGLNDRDITFIEEQISGHQGKGEWPYKGRDRDKAFLYEIVSNKRNSIDVDKWDYLARDCNQLGIKNNFDHTRFIKFARVIEMDGEMQICIRDKEIVNLYNLFSTRYFLNKNAYQHKVTVALELMVSHALIKASSVKLIRKPNGELCSIVDCLDDMAGFTHLTDNILFKILESSSKDPGLLDSKNLIDRIYHRNLYKCAVQSELIANLQQYHIKKDSKSIAKEICEENEGQLKVEDVHVQIAELDYGMKEENPVGMLNVYSKTNLKEAKKLPKEESPLVLAPNNYREVQLFIYIRDRSKSETLKEAFNQWFKVKKNIKKEQEESNESN